MKIALVVSMLALLATGCAGTNRTRLAAADLPAPLSDTALGLAKGSVFEVPTPPAVQVNESAPGEMPVLPRPYVTAPPRIPHAVGDFLPITLTENACLGCHAIKEKSKGEPTPIPSSHYTDYRHAPERVGGQVVGARYVCVSCHAVKTDAPDLVENRFGR
jgi:nitrate reductase (cytochrome), electron transfer subunit